MHNSRNTSVINRRLVKNFRWMRSIGFTDLKFSGFFQSFFQLTFDLHIISFRSYVCLFSNRIRWKEGTGRTCPSALSHCTKDEDITFCQLCRSDPDDLLQDEKSDVIIHRPDGRIRERDSYGNDPYPPGG
jgi:hypothetical protein